MEPSQLTSETHNSKMISHISYAIDQDMDKKMKSHFSTINGITMRDHQHLFSCCIFIFKKLTTRTNYGRTIELFKGRISNLGEGNPQSPQLV